MTKYLPWTEDAGWTFTKESVEKALDISTQKGFVETTAWLLDYKKRKYGFDEV